jgi:hypothetical protein
VIVAYLIATKKLSTDEALAMVRAAQPAAEYVLCTMHALLYVGRVRGAYDMVQKHAEYSYGPVTGAYPLLLSRNVSHTKSAMPLPGLDVFVHVSVFNENRGSQAQRRVHEAAGAVETHGRPPGYESSAVPALSVAGNGPEEVGYVSHMHQPLLILLTHSCEGVVKAACHPCILHFFKNVKRILRNIELDATLWLCWHSGKRLSCGSTVAGFDWIHPQTGP